MAGPVRIAEVIVGLPLGCCGLFVSLVSVIAAIVACQRAFTGQSAIEWGGISLGAAIVATLMLLGARKMLRGPRSAARPRIAGRWIAVGACGGLLAALLAIAIPNYLRFDKRSPASEPRLVLRSITVAEESYFAEFGEYVPFDSVPDGAPGAIQVAPHEYPAGAAKIGWSLGRATYCRYAVAVGSLDGTGGRAQAFTAEAVCDIDGDGEWMAWGYVRPDRESGKAVPGPFAKCSTDGVYDRSTGRRSFAVVGPCDARSGIEVF